MLPLGRRLFHHQNGDAQSYLCDGDSLHEELERAGRQTLEIVIGQRRPLSELLGTLYSMVGGVVIKYETPRLV